MTHNVSPGLVLYLFPLGGGSINVRFAARDQALSPYKPHVTTGIAERFILGILHHQSWRTSMTNAMKDLDQDCDLFLTFQAPSISCKHGQ